MTVRRIKTIAVPVLMMLLLSLFLPMMVRAEDDEATVRESTNDETGYQAILYDEGDVLNQRSEDKIFEELEKITAYGNAVFYSTVADSYADDSKSQRLAKACYESLFRSTSDGVIVAIVLDSDCKGGCTLWIQTYNGVNDVVTDSYCSSIADNAIATTRKHASGQYYGYDHSRNYYGYADEALQQIQKRLGGADIPQPMKIVTSALLALILGLLVNFMIVAAFNRKKTPRDKEVLAGLVTQFSIINPRMDLTHTSRKYSPRSSSSGGGGGGGGGGHSGGGGHRG